MKKNKRKDLPLLDFEGPVLKLHKADVNEFVIYDQWDSIVEILTFEELCSFFDGDLTLTDSEGKKWNWDEQHPNAKVRFSKLLEYLK